MDIDKKEILSRLDNMSDDDLKNMVRTIAEAAGVNKRRTEQALGDIGKLKKSFAGMSERDWQRATSMLDSDTVNDIKRQMNM